MLRCRWSTRDPNPLCPRSAIYGRPYIQQRRPRRLQGLAGRRRDLRRTKDDIQDDCHARRHAHSVLSTVFDHCTPTIRGKTATSLYPLLMYPAPPCVYKRRRRTSLKGSVNSLDTHGSENTPRSNPTSSRDLGAFLPLSPRLYPILQALRVQDNTVHSHTPFAGRTAPWPEPG